MTRPSGPYSRTSAAYSWNWGDVGLVYRHLVYRHLAYDMGDDKLLQNVEFSGPALGAAFHF
jgi:hypothetical protein